MRPFLSDDQAVTKARYRDNRGFQLGLINSFYLSLITFVKKWKKERISFCYCGFNHNQQEELVEKMKVAGTSWENEHLILYL